MAAESTETVESVNLVVTGMTCASCAARIERKLNKLEGVSASVNYATGIAKVEHLKTIAIPELIKVVENAGYGALAPNPLLDEQVAELERQHEKDLLRRWQLGLFFAVPTTLISMVHFLQFTNWQWLTVLLATPVVLWSAWPLHMASFKNAKYKTTTMDTLVSIGILAAYFGSITQLLIAESELPHIYIDVATIVPVFVLIGRWLEARNKRAAGSALRALADATPKSARVLVGGVAVDRSISEVLVGDQVLVSPESIVPVDGVVIKGLSSISNALLTGESVPQAVQPTTEVKAGAVNHEGELEVEVTAVGAGSTIFRIAQLVAAAQSGKANIARLADRISAVFVPIVLVIASLTALVWFFVDSTRVLDVVIAVLVIACPCALGLATPTALVVGSGRAATMGVLIAGPQVFEQSQQLDVLVFDKTGTLTLGQMQVTNSTIPTEYLPLLKALAQVSNHPVSSAVTNWLEKETAQNVDAAQTVAGLGIKANWDGKVAEFGSRNFHVETTLATGDATTSWLFVDGKVIGSVSVADLVDPTAAETVATLKKLGVRVVMASGDQANVAQNIAQQLQIAEVRAELSPNDKIDFIKELQSQNLRVAMVGDGTNDAPALAQADLAIAMGRGTQVAQATADITLLRADLNLIPDAIALSRATLRTIKVNLGWAFGYNIAAIPLAMTGNLNPVIAGIAMSASSVLVVANSLRLRKQSLR
jgi:P-type Cu+ transporter